MLKELQDYMKKVKKIIDKWNYNKERKAYKETKKKKLCS